LGGFSGRTTQGSPYPIERIHEMPGSGPQGSIFLGGQFPFTSLNRNNGPVNFLQGRFDDLAKGRLYTLIHGLCRDEGKCTAGILLRLFIYEKGLEKGLWTLST